MTNYSWEDFDSIFFDKDYWAAVEPYCSYVEITLAYPPTAQFKRLDEDGRKLLYKNLLDYIKNQTPYCELLDYKYEECKTGRLHVHGTYIIKSPRSYSIHGLIQSMAKVYFTQLSKKYIYKDVQYYYHFIRYKSPMITLSYVEKDDKKRTEIWDKYINKLSPV